MFDTCRYPVPFVWRFLLLVAMVPGREQTTVILKKKIITEINMGRLIPTSN